jgi:hypothetical protein
VVRERRGNEESSVLLKVAVAADELRETRIMVKLLTSQREVEMQEQQLSVKCDDAPIDRPRLDSNGKESHAPRAQNLPDAFHCNRRILGSRAPFQITYRKLELLSGATTSINWRCWSVLETAQAYDYDAVHLEGNPDCGAFRPRLRPGLLIEALAVEGENRNRVEASRNGQVVIIWRSGSSHAVILRLYWMHPG